MSKPGVKLIIGLGNPGATYEHTRHNVGADFIQMLGDKFSVNFKREAKFKGFYGQLRTEDEHIHLLTPTTYMNNSGEAVQAITQFYKIPVESLLIVHDELDLPVGDIRLKQGGGHGGHNGTRDIIEKLGTKDFLRLRIGIGRPAHSGEVTNYVLKRAPVKEYETTLDAVQNAFRILPDLAHGELNRAMQELHSRQSR